MWWRCRPAENVLDNGAQRAHLLMHQLMDHLMERRIDAHLARTQLGQIMDLAVKDNQRFVVDRRGEPAVVILSVADYLRLAAPAPDWLRDSWANARATGLDRLSMKQIQEEVDRARAGDKTESGAAA